MELRSTRRSWRIGSAVVAAALGAWVLYTYAPTPDSLYPRCVFHLATGLDCPGCGSTRAMHQLLHGNVAAAFRLNPILFALMGVFAVTSPDLVRGRTPELFMRPWFGWTVALGLIAFWIVRNLPIYPF